MRHLHGSRAGLGLAIFSALAFSTSGALAKSLIDAGWSPAAAVTARISIAALVLALPGLMSMRGRWHILRRQGGMVAAYGLIAVAGAQLFYFNAIQTLPVGVALMLEYLGIVLVAALIAYLAGIAAARMLGAKLASFAGLAEVVFAVLIAWLLLGQLPTPVQLGGGALIVAGIALVRIDEMRSPSVPPARPEPAEPVRAGDQSSEPPAAPRPPRRELTRSV